MITVIQLRIAAYLLSSPIDCALKKHTFDWKRIPRPSLSRAWTFAPLLRSVMTTALNPLRQAIVSTVFLRRSLIWIFAPWSIIVSVSSFNIITLSVSNHRLTMAIRRVSQLESRAVTIFRSLSTRFTMLSFVRSILLYWCKKVTKEPWKMDPLLDISKTDKSRWMRLHVSLEWSYSY